MTVAHWDEVASHRHAKGEMDAEWQALGDAAGCRGVGVNRVRVAPGKLPTPPHSHGASEELYFVLSGSGLAWQDGHAHEVRPLGCVIHRPDRFEHTFVAGPDGLEYLVFGTRRSGFGVEYEEIALRPGHRVARPPATRISHSFRAGPDGVTMLVYGTREPNDVCWYPRSRKIAWRGVGVIGRIETLEYFDGEPVEDD